MQKVFTKDVHFLSADTKTEMKAKFFYPEKPDRVMVLVHGMAEHMERYEDFAFFLAQNSTAVLTYNHLGHKGAVKSDNDLGFICENNGEQLLIFDCIKAVEVAKEEFPSLPVILFGHSMGSFVARLGAVKLNDKIHSLILSGTGGPNPTASIGLLLINTKIRKNGPKSYSKFINNMAFGSYNKHFEKRTAFDWLSRDRDAVDAYIADTYCGFDFTVSAMGTLIQMIKDSNEKKWYSSLEKNMPVLLLSGDMDPVGNYGKGVKTVYKNLKKAGMKDVTLKLFSGGRHEMLNEINKKEVYQYIQKFIEEN